MKSGLRYIAVFGAEHCREGQVKVQLYLVSNENYQ